MASVGFVSSGIERARAGGRARTCKCSVWVSLIGDRVCYVRSTVSTDCRSAIDGRRLPEADCARTVHTASRVGILNNMSAVWLSGSRRKQGAQEKLYPSALYTHRRQAGEKLGGLRLTGLPRVMQDIGRFNIDALRAAVP